MLPFQAVGDRLNGTEEFRLAFNDVWAGYFQTMK